MGQDLVPNRRLSSIKYDSLESFLANIKDFKQGEASIIHRFGPGIYIRESFMKKGSFAIGEDHQTPCHNIMIKGHVRMVHSNGTFTDFIGPLQYASQGGRKMGYFLEDTVWLNIFPTTSRDVELIEETIVGGQGALLLSGKEKLKLLTYGDDKTEASFRNENRFEKELPFGDYSFRRATVGDARGIFATATITQGSLVGRFKNVEYTWLAANIRHSTNPNCKFVHMANGAIDLVAMTKLRGNHGGVIGDELTVNLKEL